MEDKGSSGKNSSITERDISAAALEEPTLIECEAADNDTSEIPLYHGETEYEIFVRYGFGDTHDQGEIDQATELTRLAEAIPEDSEFDPNIGYEGGKAEFRTLEYYLIPERKLEAGKPPSESDAIPESSPVDVQNWCRKDHTDAVVVYQLACETDSFARGDGRRSIAGVIRFVEQWLDVEADSGDLSYSGGRSPHYTSDVVAVGDAGREWLKERAEEFCESTGINLDTSLYDRNQIFRMMGAEHGGRSMQKVSIELDADRADAVNKAANRNRDVRKSDLLTPDHPVFENIGQIIHGENLDPVVESHLIGPLPDENADEDEQSDRGRAEDEREFASVFGPYKNATGGTRSIFIGEISADEQIQQGKKSYLKTDVRYARGADGEFTKDPLIKPECWLELSPPDTEKVKQYMPGSTVVIIGGGSGKSKMLDLTGREELVDDLARILRNHGRQPVLEMLEEEGYDTGSAGHDGEYDSAENHDGKRLKQEVENGKSIMDCSHPERLAIARYIGLTEQGFWPILMWFRKQYRKENEFERDVTYTQVSSVVGHLNEEHGCDIEILSEADVRQRLDELDDQEAHLSASSRTHTSTADAWSNEVLLEGPVSMSN